MFSPSLVTELTIPSSDRAILDTFGQLELAYTSDVFYLHHSHLNGVSWHVRFDDTERNPSPIPYYYWLTRFERCGPKSPLTVRRWYRFRHGFSLTYPGVYLFV